MLVKFAMGIGEETVPVYVNPNHVIAIQRPPTPPGQSVPDLALLGHSLIVMHGLPQQTQAIIVKGTPESVVALLDSASAGSSVQTEGDPEDVDVWPIIMAWPILAQRVLLAKLKAVCDPNATLDTIRAASKEIEDLKLADIVNPPVQQ